MSRDSMKVLINFETGQTSPSQRTLHIFRNPQMRVALSPRRLDVEAHFSKMQVL